MADEFFSRSRDRLSTKAGGSTRYVVLAVLLAFLLGAGAAGYVAWSGLMPLRGNSADPHLAVQPQGAAALPQPMASQAAALPQASPVVSPGALESRLAALEQRFAQIDLRTEAASGNTARAEGLLIAFATRRALERGAPLGPLEDQLRLRFGDAQPNAVATLIDAARRPVTRDALLGRLDAMGPGLAATPAADFATWDKVKHEISTLFIIRHAETPSLAPVSLIDRARQALVAGRVEDAVGDVQRMPGAADAAGWIADARRFAGAQAALDLIDTTALLDTRNLKDARGKKVEQPSPVASAPAN